MSKITLTPTETRLFNLITQYIHTTNLKVVPRVAGGWVRDKLMGNVCSDIDIVLDTVSGYEFATGLKEYALQLNCDNIEKVERMDGVTMNLFENIESLENIEQMDNEINSEKELNNEDKDSEDEIECKNTRKVIEETYEKYIKDEITCDKKETCTKYNKSEIKCKNTTIAIEEKYNKIEQSHSKQAIESNPNNSFIDKKENTLKDIPKFSSVGRVKSNPTQSKHIESAAVLIDNHHIDFLQLRSETYTDTRIPQTVVADPRTDALRRDITINSLFYNIQTGEVEDYTNLGLDDLHNKIIRTPLEPVQTFLDDPLRILRVLRFACRFNFIIQRDIFVAMRNSAVKRALAVKVSRERVGIEIGKIVRGENGQNAIFCVVECGIVKQILKISEFDDEHVNELRNEHVNEVKNKKKLDNEKESNEDVLDSINNVDELNDVENVFNSKICRSFFQECKKLFADTDSHIKSTTDNTKPTKNIYEISDDECSLHNTVYQEGGHHHILILYCILIFTTNTEVKRKQIEHLNYIIVKENLMWPNNFTSRIKKIEHNISYLSNIKNYTGSKHELIRIVRKMGMEWKISLAICIGLVGTYKNLDVQLDNHRCIVENGDMYMEIYRGIVGGGFKNVYAVKPILTGKDVVMYFGAKHARIAKLLEVSVEYQIMCGIGARIELVDIMRSVISEENL